MSLRVPTFSEILNVAQSRGSNSDAPNLWDGLVGAWPLQEGGGSKAFDASGRGNRGTLTNMDPATDWVVGERGRALDFDGDDDFFELGTIPVGNPLQLTAGGTIACWFWHDGFGDVYQRLADKSTAGSGADGYTVFVGGLVGGGKTRRISVAVDGSSHLAQTDNEVYAFQTWTHMAVTVTATVWRCFVDGQEKSMSMYGGGTPTLPPSAAAGMRLGSWNHSTGREFDGQISDVRIFDRALTPSEVQQLYVDPWAAYRLRRRVYKAAGFVPYPYPLHQMTGGLAI